MPRSGCLPHTPSWSNRLGREWEEGWGRTVAEDGVDLGRAAAVQPAVLLALLAHHAVRVLDPDVLADDLLDDAQHRRVVDEQG